MIPTIKSEDCKVAKTEKIYSKIVFDRRKDRLPMDEYTIDVSHLTLVEQRKLLARLRKDDRTARLR